MPCVCSDEPDLRRSKSLDSDLVHRCFGSLFKYLEDPHSTEATVDRRYAVMPIRVGRLSIVEDRSLPVRAPSHGRTGSGQSCFLGNTRENLRKLRLQRRFDHLAVLADEYEVTVLDGDMEGTVMQQPVMRTAQQHEVLQPRLAAVDPVLDMVRFDIALVRAARKAAAVVVA